MKTYWIGLLLLPIGLPHYLQIEIAPALHFLESHEAVIEQTSEDWTVPSKEVLAIIAPELIRYHLLRDFFETQALEVAYVGIGLEAADFSIGPFQMKPSFVEKLEVAIAQKPDWALPFQHLLFPAEDNDKTQRFLRLRRLQEVSWQLEYAAAFYHLFLHRFASLHTMSPPKRISFLAAAYNYGFDEPEADIIAWQKVQAFPYGTRYRGEQAAYSELAQSFYQKLE